MTTIKGTVGALLGLTVAAAALVMIINNSPFGGTLNTEEVFLWSLLFLVGVFLFGWGLGKRAMAR